MMTAEHAALDRAGVPVRFRHSPKVEPRACFTIYKTPHEIAVIVAHKKINYGAVIQTMHGGYILTCMKKAIFQSVRDTIVEATTP